MRLVKYKCGYILDQGHRDDYAFVNAPIIKDCPCIHHNKPLDIVELTELEKAMYEDDNYVAV